MSNLFTFLLEFVRVIILLIVGLLFLFIIESKLLTITLEGTPFFLLMISNVLFILVFYRNKLQFSGWYKGKEVKKLSNRTTWTLVLVALVGLTLAFLLDI